MSFQKAIQENEISLEQLKKLANKGGVPYPFFFASKTVVEKQIKNKEKQLLEKIPTRQEMQLTSRGGINVKDIELIVNDLGRKQDFLKKRILISAQANPFLGCVSQKLKNGASDTEIANELRKYLQIDLSHLRKISKDKVLSYVTMCAEKRNILVSFSSTNFMPQRIEVGSSISGICIKDKKFPYVFINTRDGDEKPKILESAGRQIFTLLSMLVCIAMGKFVLSTKAGKSNDDPTKKAFGICGEILIPNEDIQGLDVSTIDKLKEAAHFFRVTPSMLLFRLVECGALEKNLAATYRYKLQQEVKKAEPKIKHQPSPVTGYSKYNGQLLSREVIKAHNAGLINAMEVKNVLFRQGRKMDPVLFADYIKAFR